LVRSFSTGHRQKLRAALLLPIGFGIFIVNFPLSPHGDLSGTRRRLSHFLTITAGMEVIPCVIFLGLGAMTDFGPLIANPRPF
jgi:oxaloacetate decarboxylase beta subunit